MPKETRPETDEGLLVTVAKTIGHAAGKLSVKAGIEPSPEAREATPPTAKVPKLAPKNKSRLPRRQKKALQRSTASRV